MNWTRKQRLDLLLMALGTILGVAVLGFGIAPALGVEFSGGKPTSYMLAAVAGTVGGYTLRLAVAGNRLN